MPTPIMPTSKKSHYADKKTSKHWHVCKRVCEAIALITTSYFKSQNILCLKWNVNKTFDFKVIALIRPPEKTCTHAPVLTLLHMLAPEISISEIKGYPSQIGGSTLVYNSRFFGHQYGYVDVRMKKAEVWEVCHMFHGLST